ncbi:MAG: electron transfer flavoprotein subunit alpha/FixB family protein [Dehalococcoidales bacterium]|nr:MAG: electron transfer flavoprotein subunit alpha/FixB family protein [Dehalococcoidales bacterium]
MTDTHNGIWVYAEQRNGKLLDSGSELLGEARKIADKRGQELAAVVLGSKVAGLADELAAYGADKVYIADSPVLENYRCEAYAPVLEGMIKEYKPEVFVIGGSNIGMDLAPRVAAKVHTGLAAHAVGLDVDDNGCLKAFVPSFGGSIMASITCAVHRPQMATIPPGFLKKPEKQEGKKAEIVNVEVKILEQDLRTRVLEVKTEESKVKPLESAEVVIAGGYGIGSKENWKMVEDLAASLGGSVGATRPACDEGWAVQDTQMIGQSGKTIHPDLYIGIGVSGIIHHLIGIQDSKKIVAINRDADAPIMKAADYAIVADYKDVVPALIEEFKKLKS